MLAPSSLVRVFGIVMAISVSIFSAACSGSGGGGANGPNGKTYKVGDQVQMQGATGSYCATLDSGGTRDYPKARHFAIANVSGFEDDGNCDTVVSFFKSFIPAAAGVSVFDSTQGGLIWQGMKVNPASGYAGQLGGYDANWIALSTTHYGKMHGLAAGF